MHSRDFCYWLQGFFELGGSSALNEAQTAAVKNHLALVFKHEIDPSITDGDKKKAAELQAIHDLLNPKQLEPTYGPNPLGAPPGMPKVFLC